MKFYLLDKVTELIPGKSAKGVKCWSLDNVIFQDHFPGFPTTPGVLLTESMAQLAGILIEWSYYEKYGDKSKVYPILSVIQKVKFRNFVQPGDQCIINAEIISIDIRRGTAKAKTFVNDELVTEASLSFVIGAESEMKPNPFIAQRQMYYHMILPEKFR